MVSVIMDNRITYYGIFITDDVLKDVAEGTRWLGSTLGKLVSGCVISCNNLWWSARGNVVRDITLKCCELSYRDM